MGALVVTTARQCTSGYDLSDWNKDYYSSILVDMLLDVNLEDNAKALIQDMSSAFLNLKAFKV